MDPACLGNAEALAPFELLKLSAEESLVDPLVGAQQKWGVGPGQRDQLPLAVSPQDFHLKQARTRAPHRPRDLVLARSEQAGCVERLSIGI